LVAVNRCSEYGVPIFHVWRPLFDTLDYAAKRARNGTCQKMALRFDGDLLIFVYCAEGICGDIAVALDLGESEPGISEHLDGQSVASRVAAFRPLAVAAVAGGSDSSDRSHSRRNVRSIVLEFNAGASWLVRMDRLGLC
jgi:hypothetical protein